MINETFSFPRFWKYFLYDLKQMWRGHSKAAVVIGLMSVFFYIIWVTGSLLLSHRWSAPGIEMRAIVVLVAFAVLELYQARTYGHLTDRKAGSAWLMVPASGTEKTVSMLLITCIVLPVLFFVVYLLADGFLSLVDPTYGKALLTGGAAAWQSILDALTAAEVEGVKISLGALVFPAIFSLFLNFTYFLLCGLVFKKNKILLAILVIYGIQLLITSVGAFLLPSVNFHMDNVEDPMVVVNYVNGALNWATAIAALITAALFFGVWYRVKTLNH